MSLTIRRLRECRLEEAEALIGLWRQAEATIGLTDTIEDIQRAIKEQASIVLVAEKDARLVGSIIGTFDGWRVNMFRLAVHL